MKSDIAVRIKNFNASKNKEVLPLKYTLMAQSPFSFFRGTCHLFYEDLLKSYPFKASPLTWICGDLHIENFGCYKGENRLLYFDMNDFDEAILAPLLFELARLIVAVSLKCSEIKLSASDTKSLIIQLLTHYKSALVNNKAHDIEQETATGLIKELIDKVAERKVNSLIISRTNNKLNKSKLLINDRLLAIDTDTKNNLASVFTPWFAANHYKGYNFVDAGFRIAGTGSIGIKRYLCLMVNKNNPKQKKLIDIKQASKSCILNYTKLKQPLWKNEAERVIQVQQMMQHVAPALLSSFQFNEEWYLVKQLQPTSDKIVVQKNAKQNNRLENYIINLASLTASAQLRSSGRLQSATADDLKAFALDNSWEKSLLDWCDKYAKIVSHDYDSYIQVWKNGYFKN